MIPELSPHVDRGRNSRPLGDFIEPEDLDPVVGHIPMDDSGRAVVDQVLAYLAEEYGTSCRSGVGGTGTGAGGSAQRHGF